MKKIAVLWADKPDRGSRTSLGKLRKEIDRMIKGEKEYDGAVLERVEQFPV